MSADCDQVRGSRDQHQEKQSGHDGEMNPLPDSRPNPLRAAGPRVLGHECGHIPGGHLKQTEH